MMKSKKFILEEVGNTPHILIPSLFDNNKKLILKLENKNPSGSIKDRLARLIITNNPNQKIFVDATIGNFVISLSWFTSILGKKTIIFVRDNTDYIVLDRIKKYGGNIIFSDAKNQEELNFIAKRYAIENDYFYCGSPSGIEYKSSLGIEIYKEIADLDFNSVVSYYGSGATLDGLKENLSPKISIIMSGSDFTPKIKETDEMKYQYVHEDMVMKTQDYLLKKCGIHSGIIGATSATVAMKLLKDNKIKKPLVFISDSPYSSIQPINIRFDKSNISWFRKIFPC